MKAGSYTSRTGRRHLARALLTLVLLAVVLALSPSAPTQARWPLAALAATLAVTATRRLILARRWRAGARGEQRVAKRLRTLERQGWVILHDLRRPGAGNVDHVAAGPRGTFTIETKLGRSGAPELAQARGHAAWAASRLGVPVVPVLCLVYRPVRRHVKDGVLVLAERDLARRLRRYRGQSPADVAHTLRRLTPR